MDSNFKQRNKRTFDTSSKIRTCAFWIDYGLKKYWIEFRFIMHMNIDKIPPCI